MISDRLRTPHPNRNSSSETQQLSEVLGFDDLRSRLEVARSSGDTDAINQERVRVANYVADEVNQSLWFSTYDDELDDDQKPDFLITRTIEQLDERQLLDCYGYTITASEVLDDLGVEHWIGHSNGPYFHAFILLPPSRIGSKDDTLHIIDPLFPKINAEISSSLSWRSVKALSDDIRNQDVSAVVIDGTDLAAKNEEPYDKFARIYKWTSNIANEERAQSAIAALESSQRAEEYIKKMKKYSHLITIVYASSTGRYVLEQCAKFKQATFYGRYDEAIEIVDNLYGFLPDIDVRQNPHDAEDCTRHITMSDENEAIEFLDRYLDSTRRHSLDPRIEINKGDILRSIGLELGSIALLEAAGAAYESIKGNRPIMPGGLSSLVAGKKGKVSQAKETVGIS